MTQTEDVTVPIEVDVTDQAEDDQPERFAGEEVAYDLDAPATPDGGA